MVDTRAITLEAILRREARTDLFARGRVVAPGGDMLWAPSPKYAALRYSSGIWALENFRARWTADISMVSHRSHARPWRWSGPQRGGGRARKCRTRGREDPWGQREALSGSVGPLGAVVLHAGEAVEHERECSLREILTPTFERRIRSAFPAGSAARDTRSGPGVSVIALSREVRTMMRTCSAVACSCPWTVWVAWRAHRRFRARRSKQRRTLRHSHRGTRTICRCATAIIRSVVSRGVLKMSPPLVPVTNRPQRSRCG